jgi:hypothetical protein
MKSALTSSTMICALVEVSSKRAVEDAGDTQDETRIEEGAKGLTQKVADDILLGEEYENMTMRADFANLPDLHSNDKRSPALSRVRLPRLAAWAHFIENRNYDAHKHHRDRLGHPLP